MGTMRDAAGQLATKTITFNICNSLLRAERRFSSHESREPGSQASSAIDTFSYPLGQLWDVRHRPHGGLFSEDKMAVNPQKW